MTTEAPSDAQTGYSTSTSYSYARQNDTSGSVSQGYSDNQQSSLSAGTGLSRSSGATLSNTAFNLPAPTYTEKSANGHPEYSRSHYYSTGGGDEGGEGCAGGGQ
ncbi:hypothetical protein I317_00217 [Kwoniella heveanensis CBS 569]|uniref:Uncharacterized protein n=1 Tax=Kwoniella heveanensis BCC8398 TaxID=1296120 RepID=A0A1B9GIH8_9TREE|nr:hypothetical protein I316_07595 [Kwoniella heveanensis BCC8398]OCF45730.1 hypothetical protein I317_00217 [Kwoniella heveanensis CBS 569]